MRFLLITICVLGVTAALAHPVDCLKFDGTNGYVDCGTAINLSNRSFTIEFWARRGWSGTDDAIAGQGIVSSNQELLVMFRSNDKFRFAFYNNDLDTANTFTDSDWHHWACTFSTTDLARAIYCDGNLVASDTAAGAYLGTGTFCVARRGSAAERFFGGRIDELRIWDSARTQTEIRNDMCNTYDPPTPAGLIAYYRFDDGFGTTLTDNSGNGHDGTLVGAPAWEDSTAPMPFWTAADGVWGDPGTWLDGQLAPTSSWSRVMITNDVDVDIDALIDLYVAGSGVVVLQALALSGELTLDGNDLDLNGYTITLGTNAALTELGGRVFGSNGVIQTTRKLNAPSGANIAGLGVRITSSTNLGTTTIRRGHTPQGAIKPGIARYYDITPAITGGLNATLVFCYNDAELNGNTEGALTLRHRDEVTRAWNDRGGAIDTTFNTITLTGIVAFSRWTAADGELNAFTSETNAILPAFGGYYSYEWPANGAFGDYDGDGRLDILTVGRRLYFPSYTNFYSADVWRNVGGGVFTNIKAKLSPVNWAAAAWGDYDGDGDLDALICGGRWPRGDTNSSRVYRNDGGAFTNIAANLTPIRNGTVAWGDCDGDGDLDILQAGMETNGNLVLEIWRNEDSSGGGFTNIEAGLVAGTNMSDCGWADFDLDGDMDFVVVGETTSVVYRNESPGGFVNIGAPLPPLQYGSVDWGDYDGDNYPDLLVTGSTNNLWPPQPYTAVYRNLQGSGFTNIEAGLMPLFGGGVAWGDYDNDSDLDILLSGEMTSAPYYITKVYRNDPGGSGRVFTDIDVSMEGAYGGQVRWGDYDGDGDLDALVLAFYPYGADVSGCSRLYRNNILSSNTPPSTPAGAIEVTPDTTPRGRFIWTPATDAETPASNLSYNVRIVDTGTSRELFPGMADSGTGRRLIPAWGNIGIATSMDLSVLIDTNATYAVAVQAIDRGFAGGPWSPTLSFGPLPSTEIDTGLIKLDTNTVVIGGFATGTCVDTKGFLWSTNAGASFLFSNYSGNVEFGAGSGDWQYVFTNLPPGIPYYIRPYAVCGEVHSYGNEQMVMVPTSTWDVLHAENTRYGSAWGDYDGDGDLDLACGGIGSVLIRRRDWNGYTTVATQSVNFCTSLQWADYDMDGDVDLLAGCDTHSLLIRNDTETNGGFNVAAQLGPSGDYSPAEFVDIDGDGDLDVATTGNPQWIDFFRNDSDGTGGRQFTELGPMGVPTNYYRPAMAWGDYDGDGDPDLAFGGGENWGSHPGAFIFRNDIPEGGTLTNIGVSLHGVRQGGMAWGDMDGDGDLDLIVCSTDAVHLLSNEGGDVFQEVVGSGLPSIAPVTECSRLAVGDADNDGDLDLALAWYGLPSNMLQVAIWSNDGSGVFTNIAAGLSAIGEPMSISWGDADSDGDLDILLSDSVELQVFRNNRSMDQTNTPPSAPSDLVDVFVGTNSVLLDWSAAFDIETPTASLTYNVRIGTSPGGNDVRPGMSDPSTGYRRVPRFGNVDLNSELTLHNLTNGMTFFWSVQAVDNGYVGGAWAPERMVCVAGPEQIRYASPGSPAPAHPYTNWITAAHVLQDAVDATPPGGTVCASNGVYDAGGRPAAGYTLTNRLCVERSMTIRSENGPNMTFIAGMSDAGSNGPAAVRCVWIESNVTFSGFTLTNGFTAAEGETCGGGLVMGDGNVASNCIITGCKALDNGGGVYIDGDSLLVKSLLRSNRARRSGGGTYFHRDNDMYNCLVIDNEAADGGGVGSDSAIGLICNSTIARNSATGAKGGGGVYGGDAVLLINCIVYHNETIGIPDDVENIYGANYSCASDIVELNGSITNEPLFADMASDDFHLLATSPCLDTGTNLPAVVDDLDGIPRPLDGNNDGTNMADMGCYEYANSAADSDGDTMYDAWELGYGLNPINPADAALDDDGDDFINSEEWIADTDPHDRSSFFHVTSVTGWSPMAVGFASSTGRVYTLESATNLVEGVWTNVPGAGPRLGAGGADSMTDTNEPPAGPFYRMEVQLP